MEIYLYSNILRSQAECSEVSTAWNIPFGTYHVVLRGGSHFCQSTKGEVSGVFFTKMQGMANTFFGKKYQNSPALPHQEKT